MVKDDEVEVELEERREDEERSNGDLRSGTGTIRYIHTYIYIVHIVVVSWISFFYGCLQTGLENYGGRLSCFKCFTFYVSFFSPAWSCRVSSARSTLYTRTGRIHRRTSTKAGVEE